MTEEITHPELNFRFDFTFTSPIEKVWACISDYGGWGKWHSHYSECKIIGDGIDKIAAIRTATSAKTGVTYESVLLAKDHAEHTLVSGLVRRSPPIPWINNLVKKYRFVSIGENETRLTGTTTITPNCQVSEETLEQYEAAVIAAIKGLSGSLEEHLNSQKQSSQN